MTTYGGCLSPSYPIYLKIGASINCFVNRKNRTRANSGFYYTRQIHQKLNLPFSSIINPVQILLTWPKMSNSPNLNNTAGNLRTSLESQFWINLTFSVIPTRVFVSVPDVFVSFSFLFESFLNMTLKRLSRLKLFLMYFSVARETYWKNENLEQ